MNRQEFIKRLEELLTGISEEEKQEALAYYIGYFEDAGEENEARIIQELESPEKLAASIKAGLKEDAAMEDACQFQNTHSQTRQEQAENAGGQTIHAENRKEQAAQSQSWSDDDMWEKNSDSQNLNNEGAAYTQPKQNNTLVIVLVAVIAVVTFPVWGGLAGGIIGLIIGFFGILLGIAATLFGVAAGGLIGGAAVLGVGIVTLAAGGLALGFLLLGLGALLIAVGILCLILLVLFCGQFLPWMIRAIVKLCSMPFHRKREECRI